MASTDTLAYVESKLDERRKELTAFIAEGGIRDFTEYHKLCGVIQGLDHAKQVILALAKRLERDDE